MPRRTTFFDPSSGRIVSPRDVGALEVARVVQTEDGQRVLDAVLSHGSITDIVSGDIERYEPDSSRWGMRWFNEDQPLDLFSLSQTDFPEGMTGFRVTYHIKDNPDYPRKYATDEWLGPDQWPPQVYDFGNAETTGVAHIVFRRER